MTLSKFRTENYKSKIRADKEEFRKTGTKKRLGIAYREFGNNLTAVLLTRALILGPLERLKIVM